MQRDLTVRDICRLMELHPDTVRRLARAGRLPGAYKVGRQWRFARESIGKLRGRIMQSTYRADIDLSHINGGNHGSA